MNGATGPLLSIVIATRNDNYAPNMAARQTSALRHLIGQLERRAIPSEVIVVDWNPPSGQPGLVETMPWPRTTEWVSCRVITVPSAIHHTYRHSHLRGMHAAAAWNAGIRRARAPFVLPKSADTFYSEPLADFLGAGGFERGVIYRCDRIDVEADTLDLTAPLPGAAPILRRFGPLPAPFAGIPALHTNACGDFLLMEREAWQAIRGFEEDQGVISPDVDGLALYAAVKAGGRQQLLDHAAVVVKPAHAYGAERRVCRHLHLGWLLRHALLIALRASPERHLRQRIRHDYPRRRLVGYPGVVLPSYARNFLGRLHGWYLEGADLRINGPEWGCANRDLPNTTVRRAAAWDIAEAHAPGPA